MCGVCGVQCVCVWLTHAPLWPHLLNLHNKSPGPDGLLDLCSFPIPGFCEFATTLGATSPPEPIPRGSLLH